MGAVKKTLAVVLVMGVMAILAACTPARYVQVNGFADAARAGALTAGVPICVLPNEGAQNPLFDREIAGKLGEALKRKGYLLADLGGARFALRFSYGVGQGLTWIDGLPLTAPRTGTEGEAYVPPSPLLNYVPVVRTEYDRWLRLILLEAAAAREGRRDGVVWYGEAVSSGPGRDLRSLMDGLIAALMTEFGRDTGRAVEKRIPRD